MRRALNSGLLWLLIVLALATTFRLWAIDSLPPGFHFDESFEGLEAWRILTDPSYRPVFLTGNFGVPPLNAYANAITFGLFELFGGEAGPAAMRVTAAVFGVLGVLAVYALGRELRTYVSYASTPDLGPAYPLLGAAALAIMRWHVHFSRMGIEPVIVPLAWASAQWLLLRGWRTGSLLSFTACGVVLAASMYTYQGAWIIPLLALLLAVHLLLAGRKETTHRQTQSTKPLSAQPGARRRRLGLLLAGAVALALVLPLGWFFWQNPQLLVLRPSQIAITGETPAPAGFWENAWRTARMFIPWGETGDLDPRRNLPGAPVMSLWLAIPFWIGAGMAVWRLIRPGRFATSDGQLRDGSHGSGDLISTYARVPFATLLLGLIGLALPGMVSEYAPHFHRILGAAAPAALLIALPLASLWSRSRRLRLPGLPASQVAQPPISASEPGEEQSREQQAGARPMSSWERSQVVRRLAVIGLLLLAIFASARTYFVRWASLPDLFYAFDTGLWELGQWIAGQPPETPIYLTPRDAEHPTLAFAWREGTDGHGPPVSFDGRHIFPLTADVTASAEEYAVIEHEDFRTPLLLPEVLPRAGTLQELSDFEGRPYARVYQRPPDTAPEVPAAFEHTDMRLGDGIRLAGYEVLPANAQPGEIMYLRLHWLVDSTPLHDWTIFAHLLAPPSNTLWSGADNRPGAGSLPTDRWRAGWRVIDEYQLALPPDLSPGEYALEIGLYEPSGLRLPAQGSGLIIGTVTIGG